MLRAEKWYNGGERENDGTQNRDVRRIKEGR